MANDDHGSVFDEAVNEVKSVDEIVRSRLRDAVDTMHLLQEKAVGAIDKLGGLKFDVDVDDPPRPPGFDPDVDFDINLPAIDPTTFGTITSGMPAKPTLEDLPAVSPPDIPDFKPSVTGLNIPDAPAWTAPGAAPARPNVPTSVATPTAPNLVMPTLPTLADINIPDFEGLKMPTFDADAPDFLATALPGLLQWTEPKYHPVIIEEVIEIIRRLWSGGMGLPPAVEQAMLERAAAREDLVADREIAAVSNDFSSRGFTLPTGMQAAREDQMRQDLAVKKLALNRELTIKIAEWQIENVRFAVQQGIAVENVFVNLFLNAAQRMFEAAKFQVESQLNIYNAQVALFNARMSAYQIKASVFDTLVRAEMSKVEIFKARIDAEVARGQINEQRVKVYVAQVGALQSEIDIFKAKMEAARIESELIRNQIEIYKADVSAYAERIQAEKVRFDAYEAQVKGEAAKAGIIDAEARAYSALISGKATIADINVKQAELVIHKNEARIKTYIADIDAEKAKIQAQLAVIEANAKAYTADTQRFTAQAHAETAKAQVVIAAKEAELRTNVAYYQAQVQAYIAKTEQLLRKVALALDAIKSAGQLSSTLAAGAMAGVHVGANLSGSGALGASYTNSYSEAHTYPHSERN